MFTKDVIISNINSGTKLISEITDQCVHRLIYNIQTDKILPVFSTLCGFKNPTV